MDIKCILLIIVLIALAGLSYYLYSGLLECKSKAMECASGVAQLQAGLQQCTTQALQCQDALTSLQEMCAPYLTAE